MASAFDLYVIGPDSSNEPSIVSGGTAMMFIYDVSNSRWVGMNVTSSGGDMVISATGFVNYTIPSSSIPSSGTLSITMTEIQTLYLSYISNGVDTYTIKDSNALTIEDFFGQRLQGDIVINNTYICADSRCFASQRITSFSAPNATEAVLRNCFAYSQSITSVSLPNLETIGMNGCASCCLQCSSLTNVASFDKLATLHSGAMSQFAGGCILLENVYFPALTTSSFVDATNQFNNFWNSAGTTKTHTMHFPSNLQATISGLTGYPLFGGSSGYVILAFDLPATS